jgi:hypothetical protein
MPLIDALAARRRATALFAPSAVARPLRAVRRLRPVAGRRWPASLMRRRVS